MAIYGTPLTMGGGGGGKNDTLPPLLDHFKGTRKDTNVTLSADKLAESRAQDLAGAVWVYGEHEPKSPNDGTKIAVSRSEAVSQRGDMTLTLKNLPASNESYQITINLPESDGKLHPYIYLTNNYREQKVGLVIRKIVDKQISPSGTQYENSPFDTACSEFKNRLDVRVRSFLEPTNIYSWNSSTGGKEITRDIFLLSQREAGGGSDAMIKQLPFFNVTSNRIARDDEGTARGWWLREFNNTSPNYVNYQGIISSIRGTQYLRYALSLSLDLPLHPIPNDDGSYDFLCESDIQHTYSLAPEAEARETVGILPSNSRVKFARYDGNDLIWKTAKDSYGNQFLIFSAESMNLSPFNTMEFDAKEPNNPVNNNKLYGNSNYLLSNIHQWLNSDKAANQWYTAQHIYDAPPSYQNKNGFLYEWTEQEKRFAFDKTWDVRLSSQSNPSPFKAKVVIPSQMEANFATFGVPGNERKTGNLDVLKTESNRVANGKAWGLRDQNNDYQFLGVASSGKSAPMGAWNPENQVRPLISIPINTPVELGADGTYHLLIDKMVSALKRTVTWDKQKEFYARQFTYNSKKQYQTMLEGATAYLPIMPDGQELSKLPSKSKVKLGKFNGQALQWLVCRDSADQSLRLILDGESIGVIGKKMTDNAEPNNSDNNRRNYGNDRYIWSNIRQWLNSSNPANSWYSSQHSADAPPNYTNVAGFLHEWTEKEISVLENASWVVTRHSVDGGGTESFQNRIVLPSTTEMGLESGTGGSKLDIFNSDDDRIVTGKYYWCRTPWPSGSGNVRTVRSSGTLSYSSAGNISYGVRPLCKPLSNTLVSIETDSEGCFTIV